MKRNFLFAMLCAVAIVCGCKPEIQPDAGGPGSGEGEIGDSGLELLSFSFLRTDNAVLKDDVATVISSGLVDDGEGISYYADPRALIASFEVSAADGVTGLQVSAAPKGSEDFKPLESGKTAADYMRPVTIRLSGTMNGQTVVRDYDFRFHNLNTGVPVLYLFTPGGAAIASKEVWTKGCTIYLDAAGKTDSDGTVYTEDYYGEADQLKGRGNTTWGWNKKPYAVKLDKKAELLGMPKHKRWALLANAIDRSLMRNRLALEIAGRCDGLEWSPRNRFVEVVMNGKHQGSYLLVEQIKTDANRVPVPGGNDALDPEKGGSPSANPEEMGYLIEIDRYWGNMHYEDSPFWWASKRYSGNGTGTAVNQDMVSWARYMSYRTNYYDGRLKFNYGLKDPDDDALFSTSSVQFTYIMNYVLGTEKSVLQAPHDLSRLDVDSFVDYWLVFELTLNQEPNNPGSCYMYKKPASDGGKLYAGPVWDFDYGTFNVNFTDGGIYQNKSNCFQNLNALWYVGLFESAEFRNAVKTRWAALKPVLDMNEFIEQNKAYIKKTAELNLAIWPDFNDSGDPNGERQMTTEQAIDRIKANLNERISGLDRLISMMP